VTGDPDVAFTAAFERVVAGLYAKVKRNQVSAAERAVIAEMGGTRRYGAALAKAHATRATARGVIADELRRAQIAKRFRIARPSSADAREYYATYGDTQARLVQTRTRAPWLGNRSRGFALDSDAPPQLFTIPFGLARGAVASALQGLARDQAYERWLLGRESSLVGVTLCRRDVDPQLGIVPLTDYLPFLAAQ
jgi:hypothetical protein